MAEKGKKNIRNYEIKWIDINQIKRYENNPRIHTKEQIDRLKMSIQKFGFINPIVIDKNGYIVAGEGRYLALKELGYKEIPCIQLEDLTEDEIRAFRIADNRIQELSSWDYEKLLEELKLLPNVDISGFSEVEYLQLERQLLNHFEVEFQDLNIPEDSEEKKKEKKEKDFVSVSFEIPKEKREIFHIRLDEIADMLSVPRDKKKRRWGKAIEMLIEKFFRETENKQ